LELLPCPICASDPQRRSGARSVVEVAQSPGKRLRNKEGLLMDLRASWRLQKRRVPTDVYVSICTELQGGDWGTKRDCWWL
jgi:hypothetical protein